MSSELPPAIADLCGLLMGEPRRSPFTRPVAESSIAVIEDGDGLWTVTHNGTNVGWINKVGIMNRDDYKFRAVSTHGEVKLCHSLNHAKGWLLEEYA